VNTRALPWHRRLEARVAVALTLLVAGAVAAVLAFTLRLVSDQSRDRAIVELEAARGAFESLLQNRASTSGAQTLLVTELPVFRAHLTETSLAADHATIDAMADGYRRQLDADFAIVSDAAGAWLASPGWPDADGEAPVELTTLVTSARSGTRANSLVERGGSLYLVVSVPARFADEVLGTLTAGYRLTDALARDLARLAHCQVILLAGAGQAATSLGEAEAPDAATLAAASSAPGFGVLPDLIRVGAREYVSGVYPLTRPGTTGPGRLVLLSDWEPTRRFVNRLRWQFLAGGLVVSAVALAMGVVMSRRVSRPLRDIASAASDIAGGNLDLQLPVRGTAEAATVARAFNDMSASLRVAQQRLQHDAIHDHLTKLPNRVLFMERLDRAMARRTRHPDYKFAVLFIDLDRFKHVNDSLGHAAGDRLLVQFADCLAGAVRRNDIVTRMGGPEFDEPEPDTLARFGGDEFVVLLDDIRDPIDAVRVAERVQAVARRPLTIAEQEIFVSPSIGVAVCSRVHRTGDEVVRDADLAMYRAKAAGGSAYAVFDEAMHEAAVDRLKLETELHHAVERREFRVWYQPIVSLPDGRITGVEALVRWQHPDRGLLPPAAFLRVAEELGVVVSIDDFVLGEACRQGAAWRADRRERDAFTISVNLSAKSFASATLVSRVAAALGAAGLPPRALQLEITESVAIADPDRVRQVLMDLRALGVGVSIDDFGTGYCSLSYLQQFPVDTLKIDRTFVSKIGEGSDPVEIVRLIVSLARTLGIEVVAEGMETSAQVEHLAALGCGFGQGHYFAKPLAPAEVAFR
jgi:predicted signal transduction protein with EAL and GGDEF domain